MHSRIKAASLAVLYGGFISAGPVAAIKFPAIHWPEPPPTSAVAAFAASGFTGSFVANMAFEMPNTITEGQYVGPVWPSFTVHDERQGDTPSLVAALREKLNLPSEG